jgi:hypothetical protein
MGGKTIEGVNFCSNEYFFAKEMNHFFTVYKFSFNGPFWLKVDKYDAALFSPWVVL